MVQQTANHRVNAALAFHLEEAESVQDLAGIGGKHRVRQHIHSGPVERGRRNLFGVEAMLADGVLQDDYVLLAGDVSGGKPAEGDQYRNPTDLLRRPPQLRGKDKNDDRGQAISQPPDHGVNKPFCPEFHPARQRQIEQFGRRLPDGIAEHLIAAPEEQSGGDCPPNEQAGGTSQNHHGKNQQHEANAEAAEQAGGKQQLKQQRQDAGVRIKTAEENRQRFFAYRKLLSNSLEL